MDTVFHSEDRHESNDADLGVAYDALDGVNNKSTDLFHSTDSIQYHSAEYDHRDIDLTENHDMRNADFEITSTDANTPVEFDKDVSSSSEVANHINNITQGDTGLSASTICEGLLQKNPDNSCRVSEHPIEDTESVMTHVSSGECDANIGTLEISSSVDDTSELCSIPSDVAVSSLMYDATITTMDSDRSSPCANDISLSDSRVIDLSSSDDLDGTNDHDLLCSDYEVTGALSYETNHLKCADSMPIPLSHEQYAEAITDLTSGSFSSDNITVSSTDCGNYSNIHDPSETMSAPCEEIQDYAEQVDTDVQDLYISSGHRDIQISSESDSNNYYADNNNSVSEFSPCGIAKTVPNKDVHSSLPSFDTGNLDEDVLYESNVNINVNAGSHDHLFDANVQDPGVIHVSDASSPGIDTTVSDALLCSIDGKLERDNESETSLIADRGDALPSSYSTDSLQAVLYESSAACGTMSHMDVAADNSEHDINVDILEADVGFQDTSGTYFVNNTDESSNLPVDTNVPCHRVISDEASDGSHENCDILPSSANVSETQQHEYVSFEVDLTATAKIDSSSMSACKIDSESSESNVILDHVSHLSNDSTSEFGVNGSISSHNGNASQVHDECIDKKSDGVYGEVVNPIVELTGVSNGKSLDISCDSDVALKKSTEKDIHNVTHREVTDPHAHIDSSCNLDDHSVSSEDLQKISKFSFHEANLIISDALHNNNVINGTVEHDILVYQSKKCVNGNGIRVISGFSQHKAETVLVKTFEDLCNSSIVKPTPSTVECGIDMKNIDRGVDDSVTLTDSNGTKGRLSAFSDIEAGAVIEAAIEDLSGDAVDISHEHATPFVDDSTEKAYDILSIDRSVPDKLIAHATSEDNFAHLSLSFDNTGIPSAENDVGASCEAEVGSFLEHENDISMDAAFEHLSNDAQSACEDLILPTESKITETTFHILSLEESRSKEGDMNMTSAAEGLEKKQIFCLGNDGMLSPIETYEDLSHETNAFDKLNHESETVETTLSERTYDILSIGNAMDELNVPEKPSSNISIDDESISLNMQTSINTEITVAQNISDVSACAGTPTENTKVNTEIDSTLTDEVKTIGNDHYNLSKENHSESSQFEKIEDDALEISNCGEAGINLEGNKTPIHVVANEVCENGFSKNTYSKVDEGECLTVENPSIDASKIIAIQHSTNEHHILSNGMPNGKQSHSPEETKTKHGAEVFADPLDDYVVVDYDSSNIVRGSSNHPRFSFSTWSCHLKRMFSSSEDKAHTSDNNKLSVHVDESRKISREGEEVQVLTFHRTAVKSDGPAASISFKEEGDGSSVIQGGTYNHAVVDSSGNLIEREPGIDMVDSAAIGTPTTKTPRVMTSFMAEPTDLKLAGKTLTLEKDALLTDVYPTALPGYPSDRRSLIALEIYTTERTFVRGLEIAVKIFMVKIESSNLLDSKEINAVFSNIEEILALNRGLLDDIFERISNWSDEQCIGDVFLKCKDKFSMYAEYCKTYDTGEEIIRQKQKKKDFEAVLQECYNNPKCMPGQTLSSYLITIIQRFPRYILLLKDLIKRTPDSHADSQNLKDAFDIMEEKTAYINEQLKLSQCQKALEALQTTITGLSQFENPERNLVHEGPVALLTGKKTYQCVLFNDIIVFAHKGENKQSVVDIVLELKNVWVEDLEALCPQTAKEDAIGLYTPDRPYRMYVGSTGEKKIWMRKMKEALVALLGNDVHGEGESEIRTNHYNYKNGAIYDGSFFNTKQHGFGKMTIPNLMTYEGEWEDDERNGSGTAKFCTGEVYEGMWKDDKPDGYGTFKYSTGDEISCYWKEGLKAGQCEINFKNGDKFTGECVDGEIQGYGKLVCVDGLNYSGNWLKSMKHGEGKLSLRDGTEYTGNFVRDKYHGKGQLIYPDGSHYGGEFEHGVRCGEGSYTDFDGCSYNGHWLDDKKNGRGTMTYENGDIYTGTWSMDVRQGQGKMAYSQGGFYKGVWESDLMHGSGVMEFKNGDLFDGDFNYDKITGSGTMRYKDGSRFVGEWLNGLPHERGILTKPGGWSCDGMWLRGKQNGHCSLKDAHNDYEYEGDWLNGIKEGLGTERRQGFTYTGAFLEDLYHGPGFEIGPHNSKYEGNWHRGVKHGNGTLKHGNGLIENQTWKHGFLIESPLIHIPRERTPIQRWIHT